MELYSLFTTRTLKKKYILFLNCKHVNKLTIVGAKNHVTVYKYV